ncbi:MAG: hypothetical protein CMA02_01235, partial [Euryarchaeota archaeon]|nr:hypothetical protein [Euryarchaeota archaeon]
VEGGIGERVFNQMFREMEEEPPEFMDYDEQEMMERQYEQEMERQYQEEMLERQYEQEMEMQRQQEEEQDIAISPDFPEWTQDRLERFIEIMDRLRENNRTN